MNKSSFGRRDLFKRAAAAGAGLGIFSGLRETQLAEAALEVPLADKVPTRVLGATGEEIPILLMGGAVNFDPDYDRMLHRAFRDGMFYIDAAEAYANGQAHKGIGTFIEQVGRDKIWLTSKSGDWGSAKAPPEKYRSYIEKEMSVLKTDYLDMFLMHGIEDPGLLDKEYIEMGQDMKKTGFAKYFGFSCHEGSVVELMNKAAKIGSAGIDAVMFRYNFSTYGDLELNKAMDACVKAGIGLIGMKTQTSVSADADEIKNFRSQNFTLGQAKLKAAWADERLSACVSGITNTKILAENSTAARSQIQLSMSEFQQLNRYAARTAHLRCNGCSHNCESRIDGDTRVASMLRYLMYEECYGDGDEARRLYRALRPSQRQVGGVDFAAATEACPQGIDIAARLRHAEQRLA